MRSTRAPSFNPGTATPRSAFFSFSFMRALGFTHAPLSVAMKRIFGQRFCKLAVRKPSPAATSSTRRTPSLRKARAVAVIHSRVGKK